MPGREIDKKTAKIPGGKRKISVIIPARNEENRLPGLLQSLNEEQGRLPPEIELDICVVDDKSSDATVDVARKFGARVLKSVSAPHNRAGKSAACGTGAEAAAGDFFLFLDADTKIVPGGIEKIITLHQEQGGLVSIQPYHTTGRFYESFSSYFNIIVMSGVNAFTPFSTPGKPKGCFGPCLFCSRADYFTAGGHRAVEQELVDDIALARQFLRNHIPVHCYGGRGCIEFRMYPEGFGSLIEGWTKNMATGAKFSSLVTNILLFIYIAGVTNLFLSIIQAASTADPLFIAGSAAVYLLYSLQFYNHLRRIGNFSPLPAPLFPLYLLFFIILFLYSIIRTKIIKKVRWRGREISL